MSFRGEPGQRVVIRAYGENPLHAIDEHLSIAVQPAPEPSTLAPADVIVRIRSAAVGWVDLLMASGQYQHMAEPPYTPGLEYAGEVAWAGPNASNVAIGDRVLVDGLRVGPRSKGAYRGAGGFATWAVVPADALFKLPDTLSFDQASSLLGNYETAYHCLVARGALKAGETVLIHGASGNTGLAAVHVAKLVGARVIATGRDPDKLARVQAEGADEVVCTKTSGDDPPSFRDEVKALTDGRGVDVVYDGVGGAISAESLRCVRFGARFLIVGWASTPFVAKGRGGRGAPNANQLPTNLIMMKGLDVLGCPTVISTERDPSIRKARLEAIWGWVHADQLRPVVGPAFELSQAADAMRAKWESRFVGGCVIRP